LTRDDARGLFIEERKELVLLDPSAEIAAELIADVFRFAQPLPVGEEIVGVGVAIARIFVERAMDLISAALADDANCRKDAAIFGRPSTTGS